MRITVFGASGKVGRLVTKQLFDQGHHVTVFVHNHTPFLEGENLTVAHGDIHDVGAVTEAIAESEAVVSSLGSWETPTKDILSTATKHIITASRTHRIRIFVSVTGADAWQAQDQSSLMHTCSHFTLQHLAKKVLADSEKHLSLLAESDLDWTVIRSPIMIPGDKRQYTLSTSRPMPWATITRRAVADAIVAQLGSRTWSQQAPFIRGA